eukprot:COSAG03_NODE_5118_length_1337_cov_2.481422_2_plen_281_part_00
MHVESLLCKSPCISHITSTPCGAGINYDYDDVADFEADVVHDIEHALNTNINLAAGLEEIVQADQVPEFVWLERSQIGDESSRVSVAEIKVGKRYYAQGGLRIVKTAEADPPRVTRPRPPKRLTAKRESKGETAVTPLAALDSRPSTVGSDADDFGGFVGGNGGVLDEDPGWGQQLKPTPPSSRPAQDTASRPGVASLTDAATVHEDGWQFEFEIRESALLRLQQQLREAVPAPLEGCEMVRCVPIQPIVAAGATGSCRPASVIRHAGTYVVYCSFTAMA